MPASCTGDGKRRAGDEAGERGGVLPRCRLGARVPAVEDLVGVRRPVRASGLGERRERLVHPQIGRVRGACETVHGGRSGRPSAITACTLRTCGGSVIIRRAEP